MHTTVLTTFYSLRSIACQICLHLNPASHPMAVHHFPAFLYLINKIYYILTTFTDEPFEWLATASNAASNPTAVMPFSNICKGNKLFIIIIIILLIITIILMIITNYKTNNSTNNRAQRQAPASNPPQTRQAQPQYHLPSRRHAPAALLSGAVNPITGTVKPVNAPERRAG